MNHGNLPECSWGSPLTEAGAVDADGHLQDCPHFVFSCRYVMALFLWLVECEDIEFHQYYRRFPRDFKYSPLEHFVQYLPLQLIAMLYYSRNNQFGYLNSTKLRGVMEKNSTVSLLSLYRITVILWSVLHAYWIYSTNIDVRTNDRLYVYRHTVTVSSGFVSSVLLTNWMTNHCGHTSFFLYLW